MPRLPQRVDFRLVAVRGGASEHAVLPDVGAPEATALSWRVMTEQGSVQMVFGSACLGAR